MMTASHDDGSLKVLFLYIDGVLCTSQEAGVTREDVERAVALSEKRPRSRRRWHR